MMIKCPECNKKISSNALLCPNCGLPIAHQSKRRELFEVYAKRFESARKKHNAFEMMKIAGVLEYCDREASRMYQGLALLENEQYEIARDSFLEIVDDESDNIDAINELACCYANMGDLGSIVDLCKNRGESIFLRAQFEYFVFLSIFSSESVTNVESIDQYITERFENGESLLFEGFRQAKGKREEKVEGTYYHFVFDCVINAVVEAVLRMSQYKEYLEMNKSEVITPITDDIVFSKASTIIRLFSLFEPGVTVQVLSGNENEMLRRFSNDGNGNYSLPFLILSPVDEYDPDDISKMNIIQKVDSPLWLGCIIALIYQLSRFVGAGFEGDKYLHDIQFINAAYRLNNIAAISWYLEDNVPIHRLVQAYKRGETVPFSVFSIMRNVLESNGRHYEELDKLFEENERLQKHFNKQNDNYQVFNVLSDRGFSAMTAAESLYVIAKGDDYGWKDAGIISLSYFRVIELELNCKIVVPLVISIKDSVSELKDMFNERLTGLSKSRDKNRYERKWKNLLKSVERILNDTDDVDGLELGSIRTLFSNIRKSKDDDLISMFLKDKLYLLLNECGKNALMNSSMEEMIAQEKVEKYRNPPAHTRYLPFFVAEECRDYVLHSVVEIDRWVIKE